MARKGDRVLNALGIYLQKRAINKAEVCRKTGIHPTRMTWICYESIDYLGAKELVLIAKAIKVESIDIQNELFGDVQLLEDDNFSSERKLELLVTEALITNDLFEKFNLKDEDTRRIVKILQFCIEEKEEREILKHLALMRKSPNFNLALKAAVEADWLTLEQRHVQGTLISTYIITEKGKELLNVV